MDLLAHPIAERGVDKLVLADLEELEAKVRAAGADIAVGVVEQRNLLRRFPDAQRTWLKFRGGAYSGANLFAFGSRDAASAVALCSPIPNQRACTGKESSAASACHLAWWTARWAGIAGARRELSQPHPPGSTGLGELSLQLGNARQLA